MPRAATLIALAALHTTAGVAAAQAPARLSLADAVARAAAGAADVRDADLEAAKWDARVRQARAALRPRVDAGSSWSSRTLTTASLGIAPSAGAGVPALPGRLGPVELWDARLRASQPLVDRTAGAALRAARREAAASGAERAAVAERAAARVAPLYVHAAWARAALAARASDLRLARELTALALLRAREGVVTALDVLRARTQELVAESDSAAAASAVVLADVELARALGVSPATPFQLDDSLAALACAAPSPPPEAAVEAAVEAALSARPEVAVARTRVEAAVAAEHAARAERTPRVDVFGDVGWNGTSPRHLIATRQLGVQVSMPLVDGRAREERVAERRLTTEQARLGHDDLRLQVEAEVRSALADLESARARRRAAEGRRALAQRELEHARLRFREGVSDNVAVVDAQRALGAAGDAAIAADQATAVGLVNLARAMGRARSLR